MDKLTEMLADGMCPNAKYDVFNSVCCDAYDSFYCDIVTKR